MVDEGSHAGSLTEVRAVVPSLSTGSAHPHFFEHPPIFEIHARMRPNLTDSRVFEEMGVNSACGWDVGQAPTGVLGSAGTSAARAASDTASWTVSAAAKSSDPERSTAATSPPR